MSYINPKQEKLCIACKFKTIDRIRSFLNQSSSALMAELMSNNHECESCIYTHENYVPNVLFYVYSVIQNCVYEDVKELFNKCPELINFNYIGRGRSWSLFNFLLYAGKCDSILLKLLISHNAKIDLATILPCMHNKSITVELLEILLEYDLIFKEYTIDDLKKCIEMSLKENLDNEKIYQIVRLFIAHGYNVYEDEDEDCIFRLRNKYLFKNF